jgi:hypothetical protein
VESATAVIAATTAVDAFTTVETCTTVEFCAAVISAAYVSMHRSAAIRPTSTVSASIAVAPSWVIVAVARAPIKAAPVISVIPRTRSDEHAVHKIIRAVVTIPSAGIRIVSVVTIGTDRCRSDADAHRTYSDPYANANLGVRLPCGEDQNSQ